MAMALLVINEDFSLPVLVVGKQCTFWIPKNHVVLPFSFFAQSKKHSPKRIE